MKKVLVVDDSEVNLYLIRSAFRNDPDISVEIETDSTVALSKIIDSHPDILVLDIMMPELNGLDLLKQIKSDPEISEIPVIINSALSEESSVEEAMNMGARDYIMKPVEFETLRQVIMKYV